LEALLASGSEHEGGNFYQTCYIKKKNLSLLTDAKDQQELVEQPLGFLYRSTSNNSVLHWLLLA
jgi:hypothetical protein